MFSQNPFDKLLDKATSPDSLEVNWSDFMTICDYISSDKIQPKAALNSIKKKISHNDPHVSLYAVQLLDACVSNCGKSFHLEICSREFENDLMKFLSKGHPKVIEKLKEYIKRWSEQEFKNDPQLTLIPALYNKLKQEGIKFNSSEAPKRKMELPSDPNFVSSNQEEEDIAKAIELSLKESTLPKNYSNKAGSSKTTLYPSINNSYSNNSSNDLKEPFKVKALYDFEAAEDNEITFKAGDILLVIDDRNSNWWKGSNYKGEGIFPACFVTKNLDQETDVPNKNTEKNTVKFDDEANVKPVNIEKKVEIDEAKIDRLLYLLHEADPTGERPDSEELIQLEEQCFKMGPLIDQELETVDKTHASLSAVNSQLVEALNIYCSLMKGSSTYSPAQTPYVQPQNYQMVQNYPNGMNYPKVSYVNQPQCPVIQSPNGHPIANYANNSPSMNETSYNQVYNDPNLGANSGVIHYTDLNSQIPVYSHQQMPTSTINTNALSNPISSTTMQSPVINNSQQQIINQSSYTPQ